MTLVKIMFKVLCLLLGALQAYMVWQAESTTPLFAEWDSLMEIPWMVTTLTDFYIVLFFPIVWMLYKERLIGWQILWTVVFITTGAVGLSVYVFLKTNELADDEPLDRIFIRR